MPRAQLTPQQQLRIDRAGYAAEVVYGTPDGVLESDVGVTGGVLIGAENAATAQAAIDLEPGVDVQAFDTQLTALAGLAYAGNTLKVVRVNAGETAFELATVSGGGSAASTLAAVAGEALSGDRAVYIADDGKAYHADKGSATSIRTAGLTTGAVALGDTATIQVEGPYTEPTWSWAGNAAIWLSTTGQLTQTPPTTGYLVKVGIPAGPTQMLIEPQFVAQL